MPLSALIWRQPYSYPASLAAERLSIRELLTGRSVPAYLFASLCSCRCARLSQVSLVSPSTGLRPADQLMGGPGIMCRRVRHDWPANSGRTEPPESVNGAAAGG